MILSVVDQLMSPTQLAASECQGRCLASPAEHTVIITADGYDCRVKVQVGTYVR